MSLGCKAPYVLKLIIHDDEGHKTVVPFVREEITIGRQEGNTIRLTERNVSRRHARLLKSDGHVTVEDLGSYNGIRLNGEKIEGRVPVRSGDLIQIGDYDLSIEQPEASEPPQPPPAKPAPPDARETALEALDDATDDAIPSSAETPVDPATEVNSPVATVPAMPAISMPAPAPAPNDARRDTAVIHRQDVEPPKRSVRDVDLKAAPRLVIISNELKGTEFACVRTELRIGRTDENDIPIDHRSLSRTHAKIVREDDGRWRILDMQSANGLSVNGEKYGDSLLSSGDVIELGHVKLRFVMPGEKAGSSGRGLIFTGVGLLLLGAIAGGLVMTGVVGVPAKYRDLIGQGLSSVTEPAPGVKPVAPPAGEPTTAAMAQKVAPAALTPEALEKLLREAQGAIATRSFARAVTILESAPEPRNQQVLELLESARHHAGLQKQLADIEADLSAGEIEAAEEKFAALPSDDAFAAEREVLLGKLKKARAEADAKERSERLAAAREKARAEREARAEKAAAADKSAPDAKTEVAAGKEKGSGTEPAKAVVAPPAEDRQAQLEKFFNESKDSFLAKKYRNSEKTLRRCIAYDEAYAPCHMLLGSTYARLQKLEAGLRHYRRFLELDPESPQAPQVRKLIADYEATKQ